MSQSQIISILAVVLVILIGAFVLNIPVDREITSHDTYMVDAIDAYYSYSNNTHDYKGVVMLPNPCYSLTSEAIVRESYPEQVTLAFTTTPPAEDIMCAQVIEEEPFRIIFTASPEAVVGASFNGRPVTLVTRDASASDLSISKDVDIENITIEEIN